MARNNTRPDWNAIRAEYIAGGIGQRKIAKKYGVSQNTLIKKANVEGWATQRSKVYNEVTAVVQQQCCDAASESAALAQEIRLELLQRVKRTAEAFPKDATEVRQQKDGKTMVYKLTDITRALNDLTGNMDTNADAEPVKVIIDV